MPWAWVRLALPSERGYTAARANLAPSHGIPRFPAIFLKTCWWDRPSPNRPRFLRWSLPFCCCLWIPPHPQFPKGRRVFRCRLSMGFGHRIRHRIRLSGRSGLLWNFATTCRRFAINHQHAHRLSRVPDAGDFFDGCGPDVNLYRFWQCAANPHLGRFYRSRLQHGACGHRLRYGGGLAAGASCEGIARHRNPLTNVTTIMLVGQAVAQTPSIFGLLVSFILMFKSFPESSVLATPMALLGAGLCMGFGGIGPGHRQWNGRRRRGADGWPEM